jgi:hypothetical protein
MSALRFHPRLRFRRTIFQRLADLRITYREERGAAGFWRTMFRAIWDAATEDVL